MIVKQTQKSSRLHNRLLLVATFGFFAIANNSSLYANAQTTIVRDPSAYSGGLNCVNAPPVGTRLRARGQVSNGFSIVGVNLNRTFFPELKSRVFVPNFYVPRVSTAWNGSADAGFSPQQSVALTGIVTAERLTFDFSVGRPRLTRGSININASTACLPQPSDGDSTIAGPGFQCPPGTQQVGNTSTCTKSGPSAAYAPTNRLVASTFDRPALQTQAAPADPAQDLTKWEGVSWQADRADS
jgi:hypothetical protein